MLNELRVSLSPDMFSIRRDSFALNEVTFLKRLLIFVAYTDKLSKILPSSQLYDLHRAL